MPFLETPAIVLISLCSLAGLLVEDMRLAVGLLALQFICVFIVVSKHVSMMLAIILLFSGLMATVLLGMTWTNHSTRPDRSHEETKQGQGLARLFPFLAAVIVLLFIFSMLGRVEQWIPTLDWQQSWAALLLLALNSLKLAFNPGLASYVHGLLSIYQGFMILITAATSSLVAVGLVAFTTLVIAFICSYIMLVSSDKET